MEIDRRSASALLGGGSHLFPPSAVLTSSSNPVSISSASSGYSLQSLPVLMGKALYNEII